MKPSRMGRCALLVFAFALASGLLSGARATPWAEVGDAQLRSDIEVLAAAGVIDNLTTQWPLAWGGIIARLEQMDGLDDQPEYVKEAAERVEEEAQREV